MKDPIVPRRYNTDTVQCKLLLQPDVHKQLGELARRDNVTMSITVEKLVTKETKKRED